MMKKKKTSTGVMLALKMKDSEALEKCVKFLENVRAVSRKVYDQAHGPGRWDQEEFKFEYYLNGQLQKSDGRSPQTKDSLDFTATQQSFVTAPVAPQNFVAPMTQTFVPPMALQNFTTPMAQTF